MDKARTLAVASLALLVSSSVTGAPKQAASLEATLSAKETEFFEAWKDGRPEVFEENIAAGGIFFGEYGVTGKRETVEEQKHASCDAQSFKLTNFKAIALTPDSAVLTYRAEQHGTCGGVVFNPYMNGLSVYVKRAGRWLNVVRSEVPAKDWGKE